MEKYIIVPECRPLYAMQKCFGPTSGPLVAPTRTPAEIIRLLLLQDGSEKLSIYEVPYKGAEPAKLTLDNYMLPYDEIMNMPKDQVIDVSNYVTGNIVPDAPVFPVIEDSEPAAEAVETVEEDKPAEVAPVIENKYAGMTKAERKAARRAEREAMAAAAAELETSDEPEAVSEEVPAQE